MYHIYMHIFFYLHRHRMRIQKIKSGPVTVKVVAVFNFKGIVHFEINF